MRATPRRRRMLIIVAVLAAGIGVAAYATHLLRRSELQTIDARFSVRGDRKPPSNVVMVAIDNATLDQLTRAGHKFPYPRSYDARVIDHLRRAGARTIAIDLEFNERTAEADDLALVEAIERAHGKVVLAADQVTRGGGARVLFGAPAGLLSEIGARAGDVRLRPGVEVDTDGVTRNVGYAYNGLHSFPVVTTETSTGRRIPSGRFQDGKLPIDFTGPPETVTTLPFSKVLSGKFDPSSVRGKVVIIGVSAPILGDNH